MLIYQRPSFPTKQGFYSLLSEILNLIFHNYVLIFECKYNLTIMQLRLTPRRNRNFISRSLVVKAVLVILVFFLGIFLLDKIDFPKPTKPFKQEISNDKLITIK